PTYCTVPHVCSTSRRLSSPHAPAPPALTTLSLHDALPISERQQAAALPIAARRFRGPCAKRIRSAAACRRSASSKPERQQAAALDRKSTRLNSSHDQISYAVFCLKKKTEDRIQWNSISTQH